MCQGLYTVQDMRVLPLFTEKKDVIFHPLPDDMQYILLAPPNTSKNFKGKDLRQILGAPQHRAEHKVAIV